MAWSAECHPGGLEATFTYGGLKLNDKSPPKYDAYVLRQIDGIFDLPRTRPVEQPLSESAGVFFPDLFYGERTITLSGTIRASNIARLRVMEHDLKDAVLTDQSERTLRIESSLYSQSYTISCRGISCSIQEVPSPRGVVSNFSVVLKAADPRILGSIERSYSMTFAAGSYNSYAISNFPNYGTWFAFPLVRIFENTNASWSVGSPAVKWQNQKIGVEYNGLSLSGSSWREFSTWGGIKLYDVVGTSYMHYAVNKTMVYPLLIPPSGRDSTKALFDGNIQTYCTSRSGDVRATVYWQDTFL